MMYKILITNQGFKGKGIYVGRPSKYGNPYPTKKSKYSNEVYSLKESLALYRDYVKKLDLSDLIEELAKNKEIILDCWCTNIEYSKSDLKELEQKIKNLDIICHAEILAYELLKGVDWYVSILGR